MFGCRRRGVHLTYGFGGVNFRVIPPLVITRAEIDFALRVIRETVDSVLLSNTSTRQDWPRNPYTRRLFETHPWRRVVDYCMAVVAAGGHGKRPGHD